jgi:hypothetical protein
MRRPRPDKPPPDAHGPHTPAAGAHSPKRRKAKRRNVGADKDSVQRCTDGHAADELAAAGAQGLAL